MAKKLLKDPLTVVVGSLDLKAVHTVTQKIVLCEEENKKDEVCGIFSFNILSLSYVSSLDGWLSLLVLHDSRPFILATLHI